MVHNYLTRAHLFATQREWFEAAARRKAMQKQLLLQHRRILYLPILRGLYEEHCGLVERLCRKWLEEAKDEPL